MILETATAFVSTISALSTVVKAITAAKKFSDDALALSERISKTREPENDSVRALAATTIDDDFIKIATENIQRALDPGAAHVAAKERKAALGRGREAQLHEGPARHEDAHGPEQREDEARPPSAHGPTAMHEPAARLW